MSTSYRKSPGGRRFVRLTGNEVLEIVSGESFCSVSLHLNEFKRLEIDENNSFTSVSAEEFISFYAQAMTRLQMQRLDI